MKAQPTNGGFEKVGECLYRYSSTGGYYARIKTVGKEIRRSLVTTDRDPAKRRLAKLKDDLLKIDPAKGRITLVEHRFILFRRGGVFHCEDTGNRKQVSLRTKDEGEFIP